MAPFQTIDEVLQRVGQEGWTLRAGRIAPRQVELLFAATDSLPGMMDEMFDNEPFGGEQQLVPGHTFGGREAWLSRRVSLSLAVGFVAMYPLPESRKR